MKSFQWDKEVSLICKNPTNPNALHVHEKSPNMSFFLFSSFVLLTIHHPITSHETANKKLNTEKLQTSKPLWKTTSHLIKLSENLGSFCLAPNPLTHLDPINPIPSHLHFLVGIDTYQQDSSTHLPLSFHQAPRFTQNRTCQKKKTSLTGLGVILLMTNDTIIAPQISPCNF